MPRAKQKLTATEIEAEKTVNKFARQHAKYDRQIFTERDLEGGEMDGARMFIPVPVVGLQRIDLKPHQIEAANLYDYYYLSSLGSYNHEIRDYVDRSRTNRAADRAAEISTGGEMVQRVKLHVGDGGSMSGLFMLGLLMRLFETHRDRSLRQICCPNYDTAPEWKRKRAAENNAPRVRLLLDQMAFVLGVMSD